MWVKLERDCKLKVARKSGVKREDGKKKLECSVGNEIHSITQFNMENERTAEE